MQTSETTYLRDGDDVLPSLLAFLRQTLADAKTHEHCVRTWGEMNWVGRGEVPIQEVLAYEAHVSELTTDFECTLICVYDLAHTPSSIMSDVLATHPYAIVKGGLRPNPYYV